MFKEDIISADCFAAELRALLKKYNATIWHVSGERFTAEADGEEIDLCNGAYMTKIGFPDKYPNHIQLTNIRKYHHAH